MKENDKKNYNILVIEDNLGDFNIINAYLINQILNHNIQHADSFKTAKEIIETASSGFDAILLDLSLPDLSGEELTREIVAISGDTPIIVLTGYENLDFSIKSLALGIEDYLLKDEITSKSLYQDIVYSIERKRTNAKIIESEKRYSDLFHFSPQSMIVYDLETLKILSANNAALKNYGYTETELLNMTIKDICFTQNNEEQELNCLNNVDHISLLGLCKLKTKNEEFIDVDAVTNTINFKGKIARIFLATDVTERLQYISAIEKQNKKLQEIAYTQSHIVRAPLARIMTIMNLMEQLNSETQECKELLTYMMNSAKELDEIIKDIVVKTENISTF